MNDLRGILLKKQAELEHIIESTTASAKNAPEGSLRITHRNHRTQYYYKSKEDSRTGKAGTFIKKENVMLAHSLAQGAYDKKLLSIAQNNLAQILQFLDNYHPDALEKAYNRLNPQRKKIVTPRVISEEEFVQEWSSVTFQGKDFEKGVAEIYTNKGERVRSKSEKIIADMLLSNGVPYRYEYPILLRGLGTVYPDFTVLNIKTRKEMYWEHLGMMDNADYCEKALHKIDAYIKNDILSGDRLIITHETLRQPLKTVSIEKMIQSKLLGG